MEENKKNETEDIPRMKKMMKGFFSDDMKKDFSEMKDQATKGLKRSFARIFWAFIAYGFVWQEA